MEEHIEIIKTFTKTGPDGEEQNTYLFKKQTDEEGNPSEIDAEYYAFTGSRIMIDQAENDFGPEDLPVATVIMQVRGKDGKSYTKFT